MAQSKEATQISKRDTVRNLARYGVDLTGAKTQAEEIAKLDDALVFGHDDPLADAVKAMLVVDFIIKQQTDHGNDNLDGYLAHALGSLVSKCAREIQEFLSVAGKEE